MMVAHSRRHMVSSGTKGTHARGRNANAIPVIFDLAWNSDDCGRHVIAAAVCRCVQCLSFADLGVRSRAPRPRALRGSLAIRLLRSCFQPSPRTDLRASPVDRTARHPRPRPLSHTMLVWLAGDGPALALTASGSFLVRSVELSSYFPGAPVCGFLEVLSYRPSFPSVAVSRYKKRSSERSPAC